MIRNSGISPACERRYALRSATRKAEVPAIPTRVLVGACVLWAGLLVMAFVTFHATDDISLGQWLSYSFICVAVALLYSAAFDNQLRASGVDLRSPVALYGIFYTLYYVIPLAIYAHDPWAPKHNLLFLTGTIALGFVGFYAGARLSGAPRTKALSLKFVNVQDGRAVLMLCYVCFIFVALHFGYRILIGQFFTHASQYIVDTTVQASFFEVFCGAFPFFLILLLGLAARTDDQAVSRHATAFLNVYVILLFGAFLVSSQFRPFLTALVLYVVARPLAGKGVVHLKQVLVFVCLAVFALLVIREVRIIADRSKIASTSEQVGYAAEQTFRAAMNVVSGTSANEEGNLQTKDRAVSTVSFLSGCRDALHLTNGYLFGTTFKASLASQVPRLFWKDKPAKVPTQILIEQELHMPEEDSSPSPVTQFYVEWGVPGVIIGFIVFGFLLGKLTQQAFRRGSVPIMIFAFWIWCVSSMVEMELFVGILSALRLSVVTVLMYYVFRFCTELTSRVLHIK